MYVFIYVCMYVCMYVCIFFDKIWLVEGEILKNACLWGEPHKEDPRMSDSQSHPHHLSRLIGAGANA